ncbi:hypothetical protein [Streptomyces brevispora]|uniref:hypothetical protein n=1 Tax=Streptomyces brevispora TaxID=887462 RepID=UPI00381217FA
MKDFTAERPQMGSKAEPADQNAGFTRLGADGGNPDASALKNFIAGNLAPMGVTGVTFVEPPEITDARKQIRGREDAYTHVSDGTFHGCLCGYTVQGPASSGALECPVCVLLDA